MKNRKYQWLVMTVVVCMCAVMAGVGKTAQAETQGHGARIIAYGDFGQARFHMGAEVGGEEALAVEAVGEEVITNVRFSTSDASVCSIEMDGDAWIVRRLKEGTAVITMTCRADGEYVERDLLMSNLTPLFADSSDDEEEYVQGVIRSGTVVYFGCSDRNNITSKSSEVKATLSSNTRAYVKYQCNDFYRVELLDESSSFGESGEFWGYVKKSQVSIPVTGIKAKESFCCYEGETGTLSATVIPAIADNKNLLYRSSNERVATVDGNGRIITHRRGNATITIASASNANCQAKCLVEVKPFVPVTGIELKPEYLEMEDGASGDFIVHVLPEDATRPDYRIVSADDSILTVYEDGHYVAKRPGKTTVVATTEEGGFQAEAQVVVKEVLARGITIQKTMSIDIGESRIPLWSMVPQNATNKNVTWRSANPDIATVDKLGYVTGQKVGTTKITVRSEEGGYEASCDVTVEIYVNDIKLNQNTIEMSLGETKRLSPAITPNNVTKKKIMWNSKATSIVSVNQSGKLTAKKTGCAEIVVYDRYTGAYDICHVLVNANLGKPTLKGKRTKKGVKLSWNKIPRATNYIVYRYSKKKKSYVKIATKGKSKRSFLVKKAKKGTKFRVKSYYKPNCEYSGYSNTYKVKKKV